MKFILITISFYAIKLYKNSTNYAGFHTGNKLRVKKVNWLNVSLCEVMFFLAKTPAATERQAA